MSDGITIGGVRLYRDGGDLVIARRQTLGEEHERFSAEGVRFAHELLDDGGADGRLWSIGYQRGEAWQQLMRYRELPDEHVVEQLVANLNAGLNL